MREESWTVPSAVQAGRWVPPADASTRRQRPAPVVAEQRLDRLDHRILVEVAEQPAGELGRALVELVERAEVPAPVLWGVTFVVAGDDPRLAGARPAVQPGRRIATVAREAGLGVPVALITPRPPAT